MGAVTQRAASRLLSAFSASVLLTTCKWAQYTAWFANAVLVSPKLTPRVSGRLPPLMAKRIAAHVVRDPKRAAVPSLRGYRYQILHTVQRCLELDATTLLVVEGNEDIDLIGRDTDSAVIEEQIKLRSDALEWSSVTSVLLHFAVAFTHHHQNSRTFSGILRTNAEIAAGPDCSIRRWIERRRPNKRSILRELRQAARTSGTATQKAAVSYIARSAGIEKFIDAVEWAVSAPGPEQIEGTLLSMVSSRVPHISAETAVRVLNAEVLRRSTAANVVDRTLSRLDIDLTLNNLLLDQLVDDFSAESSADMFSLVCRQDQTAAAAVIALTSRAARLTSFISRRCVEQEIRGVPVDRRAAVIAEMERLEVVVCASVISGGRRRRAVCVRDAARQARHRWEMSFVDVPTETATVAQDVLTQMLPNTRVRVDDASDLVIIADVVAASLLEWVGGRQLDPALRELGQKLRWVHRIDTREYFTAASPIPHSVAP
jgi:hypothetical protein